MIPRLIGESVTPSLPDDKAVLEVPGSEITRINRILDLFERYVNRIVEDEGEGYVDWLLTGFTDEEKFFLQGLVKK